MFLEKTIETNLPLVKTCFDFHQKGLIQPDSYVIDLDTLLSNAKLILNEANRQGIELYFMLKQLGRNPYIAKELVKLGYSGAVVVDFREAQVMMRHQIPIANVGHLVQAPKCLLQELVDYGCKYYTVFSLEKIKDLNECAAKANKTVDLLLKVVGDNDMIYSGQTAGFHLNELNEVVQEIKKMKNVSIQGVTSFPCFLYQEKAEKIQATPNFKTLLDAKHILKENGIVIKNINAPSTTSVATLKQMEGYEVNSGEPGHGLSGTTPLHAYTACAELPCVCYVSEVSHNFNNRGYCYGGGHYRRSHVKNALVGKSYAESKMAGVIPPSLESIDYYFELDQPCDVNDTVVMAFRFQIFVTRSQVCIIKGIHEQQPELIGIYSSLGDEIK